MFRKAEEYKRIPWTRILKATGLYDNVIIRTLVKKEPTREGKLRIIRGALNGRDWSELVA